MSRQAKFIELPLFAERLRAARKTMGLTQTDFAALGGVVLNSQNRYEAGATEPAAAYLAGLAHHKIDIGYLLTGRRTGDSLDETMSAIVTAIGRLAPEQRAALLAFLKTLPEGAAH